jgi:trimeric autotransporter adhesin
VSLSAPAPAGGAVVALAASPSALRVPSSVAVAEGATSASFAITTVAVAARSSGTITATWQGVTRSAPLVLEPAAAPPRLDTLVLTPARIVGGQPATARIGLTAPAPAGGLVVRLRSSRSTLLKLPSRVTVPAGARYADIAVATVATRVDRSVNVSATLAGRQVVATVSVLRR